MLDNITLCTNAAVSFYSSDAYSDWRVKVFMIKPLHF